MAIAFEERTESSLVEGGEALRVRGTMVVRPGLMDKVVRLLGSSGIVLVCAPFGFGKTTMAMQYASKVEGDPSRGQTAYRVLAGMSYEELKDRVEDCLDGLDPCRHPLIVLDDVPFLTEDQGRDLYHRLKQLRERGYEFMLMTVPSNLGLIDGCKDVGRLGSKDLLVRAEEYHGWAEMFSIASGADVYRLTQGVPSLLVTLGTLTERRHPTDALKMGVRALYRSILSELRRSKDSLYRLASMLVLLGHGKLGDVEQGGMRVRKETLRAVMDDYPVFGYNAEEKSFSCMGEEWDTLSTVRRDIANRRPGFASRAVRIMMKGGQIDQGVHLAGEVLPTSEALEVVSQFPAAIALCGHAGFINDVLYGMDREKMGAVDAGLCVAVYLSALTMADYHTARSACDDLHRRVAEIESTVSPLDWECARAASEVWGTCRAVVLPELSPAFEVRSVSGPAYDLRMYNEGFRQMVDGAGTGLDDPDKAFSASAELYVPGILLDLKHCLSQALHGGGRMDSREVDRVEKLAARLADRRLTGLAVRARMVAATMRLMGGRPIADERAYVDAGTYAIRESDQSSQLLCLLGEGWQALTVGQVSNAQFRSQQIFRLSGEGQGFLRAWARLLDRVTFILQTPLVKLRDEADYMDLSVVPRDASEAWATALILSAARHEMDLSAWFSLYRGLMLDPTIMPMARLAMHAIGRRADAIRRMLPEGLREIYALDGDDPEANTPVFEVLEGAIDGEELGRVDISLFGGFRVVRNGHVLTEDIWRRKKVGVLAARLALACGSFITRQDLLEEMWPHSDYKKARGNLYTSVSALRGAFRQEPGGPQYLLGQGDGLALNIEYVTSDVMRFEMLARNILLQHPGTSARTVIDACLKLEQIYAGPLFVPEMENPLFFIQMRRSYQSRYIDCMMRGIDAAMEEQDTAAASWLVETALKHAPLREDVMRHAMKVYAACGRKREVVELYSSRLQYLEQTVHESPEEETRELYETLVGDARRQALIGA